MREEPVAVVRPQDVQVPKEALELISRNYAERYRVCPIALSEMRSGMRTLTVATTDPSNLMLLDQLQQMTGCRINPVQATEQDIMRGLDVHYSNTHAEAPTDLLQRLGSAKDEASANREQSLSQMVEQRGASGTVEGIIQRAIDERASDIHIEPQAKAVYVRFRVDGVMYDHMTYDITLHPQVISRIKILSKLDIAQNRLPQDGRFEVGFGDKEFDVRVSIIPATNGEKSVMRMLPKGPIAMDLEHLGLTGRNLQTMEEMIHKPFGMLLATGPTGSGKTTTLYACLTRIDCVGKNVITIEDPVEYQLPRITQMQVHNKIGLSFANGLRAILRQDPDIIMVGEIRDVETLRIAMQSALTGHMVLSTLHCNDAAAGAARMVDMGAEPFLVATSINGIMAQRLVRKICENCKTVTPVGPEVREKLGLPDDGAVFYHGKGCSACRGTGYMGRVSVFEVVPMNEDIQQAIIRKVSASEIRNIMHTCGYPNLRDDGMDKAREGITSLEEVMRAVYVDTI
ncbi:MAG: GspE/PulE family protein [Armatimonadota bacterium]